MNRSDIRFPIFLLLSIVLWTISSFAWSAEVLRNIVYGEKPQQVLDLYSPDIPPPYPFVVYIHGGGWWTGSKENVDNNAINYFTARGIAYAAIDYRNLTDAKKDGLFPPVLGPLHDAKRALQFLRHNAAEYGLDPDRTGVYGASSGGFNALWLGLRADQADSGNSDPVERMSTRVTVIGAIDAQTSIDPKQMRNWVGPDLRYGGHAFGLSEPDFEQFLARRAEFAAYLPYLSPASLIRDDAPPVHLLYRKYQPESEREHMYFVHSPNFGTGFMTIAVQKGLQATLMLKGAQAGDVNKQFLDRLVAALKQ